MAKVDEREVAAKASSRFQRVSAQKARMVADLIRGRSVVEAEAILKMTHRPSAAPMIERLLKSAVANVDRTAHPDAEDLVIGEIQVNGGPIMYRMQPRARGRAGRIRKRFCHVSIKLMED